MLTPIDCAAPAPSAALDPAVSIRTAAAPDPLQERLTRRFACEAVRLVRDGKPPAQVGG